MKEYLTKTDIISYIRCPKKLWIDINTPDVTEKEPVTAMIINGGFAGQAARDIYNDGVMVNWETYETAIEDTKKLMADKSVNTIYEATFLFDGILIRVDILTRDNNKWNLIEVKSGTKLTIHQYNDVAIQLHVLTSGKIPLSSQKIMYIDKEFMYEGDGNYDKLFLFEDVKEKCLELASEIAMAINDAKNTVKMAKEPNIDMAPMCKQDYICGRKTYCESQAPDDHISFLPRGGSVQKKLAVKGLNKISEITNELGKSKIHHKVYKVTMTGDEEYIIGADPIIAALPFPHHYLDFESIQYAVPIWNGVKPWRQVGFQWSNHKHEKNGKMNHNHFLDISGADPRRAFAESLVKECGHDNGAVLVYNKPFERMIMEHLKTDFPDLAEKLESIRERCFDLLPIMQHHYYSPKMHGSWSIKKVLTCFVPNMDYGMLDGVKNGTDAQIAYLNSVDPDWEGDKDKLKENMLEYCKYDTLSMVKLVESIHERENKT